MKDTRGETKVKTRSGEQLSGEGSKCRSLSMIEGTTKQSFTELDCFSAEKADHNDGKLSKQAKSEPNI